MNFLEATLEREVLSYAVGLAITCPGCEAILDTDDSVLMVPKPGKDGRTAILCGDCHDKMIDKASALDFAALVARYDTTDGRELATLDNG